jgi:hypothetical protein
MLTCNPLQRKKQLGAVRFWRSVAAGRSRQAAQLKQYAGTRVLPRMFRAWVSSSLAAVIVLNIRSLLSQRKEAHLNRKALVHLYQGRVAGSFAHWLKMVSRGLSRFPSAC